MSHLATTRPLPVQPCTADLAEALAEDLRTVAVDASLRRMLQPRLADGPWARLCGDDDLGIVIPAELA